jgi:hypothetical protein
MFVLNFQALHRLVGCGFVCASVLSIRSSLFVVFDTNDCFKLRVAKPLWGDWAWTNLLRQLFPIVVLGRHFCRNRDNRLWEAGLDVVYDAAVCCCRRECDNFVARKNRAFLDAEKNLLRVFPHFLGLFCKNSAAALLFAHSARHLL